MRPPVLFVPTAESHQTEYEKNVARGESWIKHGLKPYEGPFPELDMSKTWHCPECRELNRPLKLSSNGLTLYCTNPAYVCMEGPCEYGYSNAEGREVGKIFWSSGYELPLSTNELINLAIEANQARIASIQEMVNEAPRDIEFLEQKIIKLKAQLK